MAGNVSVSQLDSSFRQYLANKLSGSWKQFIHGLPFVKVLDEKIDEICKDYKETSESCYQAFRWWCGANPRACWSDVCDVLHRMCQQQLLAECDIELRRITSDGKSFNFEMIIDKKTNDELQRKKVTQDLLNIMNSDSLKIY